MTTGNSEVHNVLAAINSAWREGRPQAMRHSLHPEITMTLPGFHGTVRGRDTLIASFEEFCANARVLEYEESEETIEVVGDSAIATYRFRMLYERASYREVSTGRDLWVFQRQDGQWLAVWRTMLDLAEERSAR